MTGQKISTHLWFDKGAVEAANFYASIFDNAKVNSSSVLENTPSGNVEMVNLEIEGMEFTLLAAGPLFKFNPSISFLIACDTKEEVERLWKGLAEGGMALMELGEYPFSGKYGWTADKYGVSWQIMLTDKMPAAQKITPTLMFVGKVCGRAEEAVDYYTNVFKDSNKGKAMRYGAGEEPDKEGTIRHIEFAIEGQGFAAMDSAHKHEFAFNEAVSLMVHCANQEEIDYYWGKLSAVPDAEQCGWLKDKFGVSWQIVPNEMGEMMAKGTKEQIGRVTKAFLAMKKFEIEPLRKAFQGE